MNPEWEKLHDIEGLDFISRWPLSVGAWAVISIVVLIACALLLFIAYRIAFKRSWKNDTFQKLLSLEKNLSDATARETAMALSEYLRRIALKRFPRKGCAGLIGDSWLRWLKEHDPNQFDWEKKGVFLIEVPYAPMNSTLSTSQIKDLIQAIRNWVR